MITITDNAGELYDHSIIFLPIKDCLEVFLLFVIGLVAVFAIPTTTTAPTSSVLVTAVDMETAAQAVAQVGGTVTHELGIVNGVGTRLTEAQYGRLATQPQLRLYLDRTLEIAAEALFIPFGMNLAPLPTTTTTQRKLARCLGRKWRKRWPDIW